MALERSPRKRRRQSLEKVLCDAEKSSLVAGAGGLDTEDAADVWLVRVPWELNASALDGLEVDLTATTSATVQEKAYRITASPSSASHNCAVVLPSSRPGQLVAGPPLAGQLAVHRVVPVQQKTTEEEEEEEEEEDDSAKRRKVEMPSGLRQRWKPFGWKDPPLKGASPAVVSEHRNEAATPSPNKAKKTKAKRKKHHKQP